MINLEKVQEGAIKQLLTWRADYPQAEYPDRIIVNLFREIYALEGIWHLVPRIFDGSVRHQSQGAAFEAVMAFKAKYAADYLNENIYTLIKEDRTAASIRPSSLAETVYAARARDNASVTELEYAYWYYFRYCMAATQWLAYGLRGLSRTAAFYEAAGGVVGGMKLDTLGDVVSNLHAVLGISVGVHSKYGENCDPPLAGSTTAYPQAFPILPGHWSVSVERADPEEDESLLERANNGDHNARYEIGRSMLETSPEQSNRIFGLNWIREAAVHGDKEALSYLGQCHLQGYAVPEDTAKALDLLRLAAKKGDAYAHYNLGHMYDTGRGVRQNPKKAFQHYLISAEEGVAFGKFHAAQCYERGLGVKADREKAVYWYKAAAAEGDDDARQKLSNWGIAD